MSPAHGTTLLTTHIPRTHETKKQLDSKNPTEMWGFAQWLAGKTVSGLPTKLTVNGEPVTSPSGVARGPQNKNCLVPGFCSSKIVLWSAYVVNIQKCDKSA